MTNLLFGSALLITAVLVIVSAGRLSAFERRLANTDSSTKVTGWSGTRKGTQVWRGVGILLAVCGIVWIFAGLVPMLFR